MCAVRDREHVTLPMSVIGVLDQEAGIDDYGETRSWSKFNVIFILLNISDVIYISNIGSFIYVSSG